MPTRRQIEGNVLRLLVRRARYPLTGLPPALRPIPMLEIKAASLRRLEVLAALRLIAPTADEYLEEFSAFWDNEVVSVAIDAHRDCYGGEFAGTGTVDFMEAFALYALVRERKPSRVLELGFASGVSSCVLATALVCNGAGELDTVDIEDNGNIIPWFYALANKGVIHPHFGDAVAFIEATDEDYQLTFSDALHSYEFNVRLATQLRQRFPDAVPRVVLVTQGFEARHPLRVDAIESWALWRAARI